MALALPSLGTALLYLLLSVVLFYAYRVVNYLLIEPYNRYTVIKRQNIPSARFVPVLGNVLTLQQYASKDRLLYVGKDFAAQYGNVMQFMLGKRHSIPVHSDHSSGCHTPRHLRQSALLRRGGCSVSNGF